MIGSLGHALNIAACALERAKMYSEPLLCAECAKPLKVVFIVILCNECLEKAIQTRKAEAATQVIQVPAP